MWDVLSSYPLYCLVACCISISIYRAGMVRLRLSRLEWAVTANQYCGSSDWLPLFSVVFSRLASPPSTGLQMKMMYYKLCATTFRVSRSQSKGRPKKVLKWFLVLNSALNHHHQNTNSGKTMFISRDLKNQCQGHMKRFWHLTHLHYIAFPVIWSPMIVLWL